MGLFDGILGSLIGKLDPNQQKQLMSSVSGLLQNCGGIDGIMQKFNSQGLGDLVKGWVSTGPNPEATPQQVEKVLGAQKLDEMSSQTGIARDEIAGHVAQTLPQMVDKLTPDGQPVSGDDMQQKLASLMKGDFGKLFS